MNLSIDRQTILITGAAGRIGSAIARSLHDSGASLVLTDINTSSLETIANQLSSNKVLILPSDITSERGIETVLSNAIKHYHRIHSVVHCAYPRTEDWGTRIEDLQERSLSKNLSMHVLLRLSIQSGEQETV